MLATTPLPDRTHYEAPPASAGFHKRQSIAETATSLRLVDRAVVRAKEGDRDAIRFLYQRYADNVYGYVCTIVRDDHEAEDVTQQVFAKLVTSIVKYEPRGVPFSSWIFRVARNVALDHLRERRAVPCEDIREPARESAEDGRDRLRSFREALESLPQRQREVLVMRHLAGLSPLEIADRLGASESAVHGLHHRGRAALKAELRRFGAAPTVRSVAVGT